MSSRRANRTRTEDDDVDELLKATEDQLLLNLTVDSHISKLAPSYIDSDLNRRFQALKKPSSSSSSKQLPSTSILPTKKVSQDKSVDNDGDGGDLLARFAALKGSRHSSAIYLKGSEESEQRDNDDQLNEEDEVEKIIQWAKDAARLDPSPLTDSDDSENFQPSDDEGDSEEELEEKKPVRKKRGFRLRK